MFDTQRRFESLAEQFETLADRMEKATEADERKELLRRMSVIIGEVDTLIVKEDGAVR